MMAPAPEITREATSAELGGLSDVEAHHRLATEGPNTLPRHGHRTVVRLAQDVLREPMLILLLVAGAVYLLVGELPEALTLLAFACFSVTVSIVQEGRTDRAIESLAQFATPRVTVIRGGIRQRISAAEVVRGDLLTVKEGDRIAADGWVVAADNLRVDEAILTGESVPVGKRAADHDAQAGGAPQPGGDELPFAFSGTLAVRGSGILLVTATGQATRIGAIGQSLAVIDPGVPQLTVETRRLVRWFAILGLAASATAVLLYGLLRGGWLTALLSGIALSMSLLPEELPVVLTLFMTMGGLRLSRVRVLARRGAAIESLGAATVLCTDKTGTLTQNRMTIVELRLPDGERFIPGAEDRVLLPRAFVELAGLGVLASQEQPFDPMETAFHDLAERHGSEVVNWRQESGWTLHRQYPLRADLLAVSHVWGDDGAARLVAAKGAPEAIADLCALPQAQRAALDSEVDEMAGRGLRILAIAEAAWTGADLPPTQRAFEYTFRGLVALADPIRPSVPPAIAQLQCAGIRLVMITGDYPLTAQAIAAQAGLRDPTVMTGAAVAALDDAELAHQVAAVSVFARIVPEQKVRIVEALKSSGEIVAMIGDGVNDAPSLKAADIGVAMGKRGTDVAREAAAIVLLDDDFAALPKAVGLGRRIYDNLRKAGAFIFAVHVPIAGVALSPLLLGWPIILGPMHIAALEMIIDPVCALAFEAEPEEPDVLRRRPRDPNSRLFPRRLLAWAAIQGAIALTVLLGLAAWVFGQPELAVERGRAAVFVGLVASVLVIVGVNRTFPSTATPPHLRRNLPLLVIAAGTAALIILVFAVPQLARALDLGSLHSTELAAVASACGSIAAILFFLRRLFGAALSD